MMTPCKRGRNLLRERLHASTLPFTAFAERIHAAEVARVPGTAVFMYSDPKGTPPALLHNLEHNRVLHEEVILLSVETHEVPRIPAAERGESKRLAKGFSQVILHYGYMENPNVPRDLARLARSHDLHFDPRRASYFLGRERLLAAKRPGMALWREQLFALMSRKARNATDFFQLPPDRVVELGAQVEL